MYSPYEVALSVSLCKRRTPDPGALELLCRIHNHVMKGDDHGGHGGHHNRQVYEDPDDHRMRCMTLSGINTLAAANKAKL